MFSKILIANRGEIACRVMRTAQAMGVRCVAVYSDADRDARHVQCADEAVHIGPAAADSSYLCIDKIIHACQMTGAQAVHPGYGFLSENASFVEALNAQGIAFIGPGADAIRAMGLKDAAKATMQKAGVPIVPGFHGDNQDPDFLAERAQQIGYPVLIKARAGGGGKGMRRVDRPEDFKAALAAAQREGLASFADGRCLIEKYLQASRHIEVQIFADQQGNVVHLFERDCSLQRRHQKVIEEAPAPGVDAPMRAAMGQAAVNAAKAIGYCGAGTVEFIADVSDGLCAEKFYFMEMNTRLQVEHPVTEAITGVDLVAWQLQVAAGAALPKRQADLQIDGWAFEARLYAEDVPAGFLPATGTLAHLSFPSVRIDTGVVQGDRISPYYDPMIAKIITKGKTRSEALNALAQALADTRIGGATTNLAFLRALCANEVFRRGQMDTGLIDRALTSLIDEPVAQMRAKSVAAMWQQGLLTPAKPADVWAVCRAYRHWGAARRRVTLLYRDAPIAVDIEEHRDGLSMCSDGLRCHVRVQRIDKDCAVLDFSGHLCTVHWAHYDDKICVFCQAQTHEFRLPDPLCVEEEAAIDADSLRAPMPGLVQRVSVQPGQSVRADDVLLVLEAMKMEHTLKAPRDGVVASVSVCAGEQVEAGLLLLTLEVLDE